MSDEYSVVPLSLSPASVAMPRKDDNNVIVSSGPARRITQLRVIASAIPPPSPLPTVFLSHRNFLDHATQRAEINNKERASYFQAVCP